MSSLSSDVSVVYVPVLYRDVQVGYCATQTVVDREGCDCYDEEEAEREGADMVARYVENHNEYCYCVIQKRIVPIYK